MFNRYYRRRDDSMKICIRQDVYGMARAGFTPDRYEVYVDTNDGGNIPHFHYRNASDWESSHTCICIEMPKYFHHTGKESTLNSRQVRQLHKFLTSTVSIPRYEGKFKNNYELICFLWDINNSSRLLGDNIQMPDYLHNL